MHICCVNFFTIIEFVNIMNRFFFIIIAVVFGFSAQAQSNQTLDIDSLKYEIFQMKSDIQQIQLNLNKAKKRFNAGIIVATVGYSVTIAGGLILGQNADLGNTLLWTGGAIGVGGTFLLMQGFKFIGNAGKPVSGGPPY
jgi:hypothetical protein